MREELSHCGIAARACKLGARRGFSLMEVVIASALLIAAMAAILKALGTAHASTAFIEDKTVSLMYAQNKLDEIRARSIYHYSDDFSESNAALGGLYLCSVSDDGDADLRTVTVSVGYDDNRDGVLASDEVDVTLTTMIAKRWDL
jgi:type II secretion system protein I